MTISEGVAHAVLAHARKAAPEECCGLLIGTATIVTMAAPARNIAADRLRRYHIDPHDHLNAIRAARARGEQVIGAYHSHPRSSAVPSPTDRLEGFADFLFIIAGLADDPPVLTAWRWVDGNFTPVPLVRVP